MSFPFYLLKSLTKMAKRVQSNPGTAHKSLFHQGLIKMLVLYALREVRVSWKQLLASLGFDEQDPKQKKPKASTRKGNTSRSSAKLQEVSPVARRTRSSKRKLESQQEEEIKLEPESSASKHELTSFDRVYTRRMAKQRIEQLQEVKSDPETEIDDAPVEKPPQVKQSKGNKGKGKQPVNYPNRPKTRATNKLRLNSKAMFKPSLKKDNLIILDDDITKEIHKKTIKEEKATTSAKN
jgi:hypothetical protein